LDSISAGGIIVPHKIVGIGEILWDVFPHSRKLGGAPANFAYFVKKLGQDGLVASRVGHDFLGKEIMDSLFKLGLAGDFIQIDSKHQTGTVDVKIDDGGRPDYIINKNVAWDFLELNNRWEKLAEDACRIEIDTLKKPIGKQDQYIAAYGNMRFITFTNREIKVEQIELSPEAKRKLNEGLMLFYTGITRQASEVLAEQKANINKKQKELERITALAFKARSALLNRSFDEFGGLLHQGWEIKKQLSGRITNTAIDEMYEAARKAGATGGKIAGAGGGGCLLLYCHREKQDEVRRALKGLRELPFHFERDGSKVIFNYRRAS